MPKPRPQPRSKRPPPPPPPPPTSTSSPTPFTPPSPALSSLLSTLPTPHIYILHLDPSPLRSRALLFALTLLFNLLLLSLLAYRLYHALPTYISLFLATLGYPSPHAIDFATSSAQEVLEVLVRRMGIFFLDGVVLGRWVAEWPLEFFAGARLGSPVLWRLRISFPRERGREVVVRRSRRWAEAGGLGIASGEEWWRDNPEDKDQAMAWEKIKHACRKEWVRGKSGLMMVDKDWDLYFRGMVEAHFLLEKETIGWEELERAGPVVAVWGRESGWVVWRPWEDDGDGMEKGEREEKERGQKLRLFKDLLTAMGREGLFFRWVELMQFESAVVGGNGEGRSAKARKAGVVEKSRKLFEEQGMDWDKIMDGIGGADGLPGMEVTA